VSTLYLSTLYYFSDVRWSEVECSVWVRSAGEAPRRMQGGWLVPDAMVNDSEIAKR